MISRFKYIILVLSLLGCEQDNIERKIEYHSNGKIKAVGNFVNGKQEGVFAFFREDGTLKEINEYKVDSLLNVAQFDEQEYCYKSTHQTFYESNLAQRNKGESYNLYLGFKKEPIGEVEVQIEEQRSLISNSELKVLKPERGFVVSYSVGPEADLLRGAIIDKVEIKIDTFTLILRIPFGFEVETVSNE